MPGIAGVIAKSVSREDKSKVDLMVQSLVHEPTYTSGSLMDGNLGIAVGWTSHLGSFSDCCPIWNENRDVCLVFSGENLAEPGVAAELKAKGHAFSPDDASFLVHWYEEEGLQFLEQLNGMFSGVLLDLRQKKVALFNDRYGMNRINFHETDCALYFASEAKALLKILPVTRRLDMASVGEFFSGGCVLQNRTLFEGIRLIPGGSVWTFEAGRPALKESYFDQESWENQPILSPGDYYEKFKATWLKILPRYIGGRESFAVSLTGGVDSRLIISCARRPSGSLTCYTFGGPYRDCADVALSRRVAALCGQPHQTIPLGREFLSNFPELVEKSVFITDGTLDPTGAADLYVNRIARKIAPVRVTGLNGGEILRRLVMFKAWYPREGLLTPEFHSNLVDAETTYGREIQGHRLSFIAFKQSPWHLYPRLSIERSQLTIRSPYFDNELIALAYQGSPGSQNSDPALRLVDEENPGLGKLGTDRALLRRSIPGVTAIQHALQEFTFKAEYAYDYGMPQWLARIDHTFKALQFEKLFLGRHKFYHYRIWYRDEFADYLKEVLLDARARSRPYLNGKNLEEIVKNHTQGHRNYTLELHRLLTLELAQRQLIEKH